MPAFEAQSIQKNIICLSFMEEENEKAKLCFRFTEDEGIWIKLSSEDNYEYIDIILNEIRESRVNKNRGWLLALFFDKRHFPNNDKLQKIEQIQNKLCQLLPKPVETELQFVFLGRNPLNYGEKETCKEFIKKISKVNELADLSKNLFLVAHKALSEDTLYWDGCFRVIDIIRRVESVNSVLPTMGLSAGNDYRFIRYARYEKSAIDDLNKRKSHVLELLGSGNGNYEAFLARIVEDVKKEIDNKYIIDGNFQPLHAGLEVRGFFNICKVKRNSNNDFIKAGNESRDALIATGNNLKDQIRKCFASVFGNDCDTFLKTTMEKQGVGLKTIKNKVEFAKVFKVVANDTIAIIPRFEYKDSYTSDITSYLNEIKTTEICNCEADFYNRLRKSYFEIDAHWLDEREKELNEELKQVNAELERFCTEDEILNISTVVFPAAFNPTRAGAGIYKYIIIEKDQESAIEHGGRNHSIDYYYLGVGTIDAPLEGIQILSCDCTDDNLDNILLEI